MGGYTDVQAPEEPLHYQAGLEASEATPLIGSEWRPRSRLSGDQPVTSVSGRSLPWATSSCQSPALS
jgi:hypothetical protein